MSRVSDLENKVASLEKNVGMLAKLADVDCCLRIAQYSSIVNYDEGIQSVQKQEEIKEELENRRREFESQFTSNEEKHEIPWKLICRMFFVLKKLLNVDVMIDYCDNDDIMTIIDGKTQSKIIEISLDDFLYKVAK